MLFAAILDTGLRMANHQLVCFETAAIRFVQVEGRGVRDRKPQRKSEILKRATVNEPLFEAYRAGGG